jgi:S-adenosylmethionine-diacylgycerolhomoserine-N-methlytransferase
MNDLVLPGDAVHADHMDRMYRYTRHVYDATRRYYLLGRDRLLRSMLIRPGDCVLEMGCGTARNLIKLHRLHPQAHLFGLDASQSMLATASRSLSRFASFRNIALRHCLAERLDHQKVFDLPRPFDVIFFSYSLSMMPTWPQAIDAALANLHPQGRIYIIDFWDQAGLPNWFATMLKRWLTTFHVHYRPELLEYLGRLVKDGRCQMKIESIGGQYAYFATLVPISAKTNGPAPESSISR